jgi:hypothetical protein
MVSLLDVLAGIGVRPDDGLREALESHPPSLHEIIRVATLPQPRLDDLEPEEPSRFASFEVNNPQGLVRWGGTRWFLSSETTIRRVTIEGDDPFHPTGVSLGPSRDLDELLDAADPPGEYDHIGDLGFRDSIVYVPIRRATHRPPHLLLGLSTNLWVVGWSLLDEDTGESTCAVSPWNRLLYVPTAEDTGCLVAYDTTAFDERLDRPQDWGGPVRLTRREDADIQLRTPQGTRHRLGMQGLAFSANGRIYVVRSFDAIFGAYSNHMYVYSALSGRLLGDSHKVNFPGARDEIEGIEVHPAGVLYVAVNDNDVDSDDFHLYSFRFPNLTAAQI